MAQKKQNPTDYERNTVTNSENSLVIPNVETTDYAMGGNTMTANQQEFKDRNLPIIGGMPIKQQYMTLIGGLVVGAVGLGYSVYSREQKAKEKNEVVSLALKLQSELQLFDSSFTDVIVGKNESLKNLLTQKDEALKTKAEFTKVANKVNSSEINRTMKKINEGLDTLILNVGKIEAQKTNIADMESRVNSVKTMINSMHKTIDKIQLGYVGNMNARELENFLVIKNALNVISQDFESLLLSDKVNDAIPEELKLARQNVAKAIENIYYGGSGIRQISMGESNKDYQEFVTNWVKASEEVDTYVAYAKNLGDLKNLTVDNKTLLNPLYKELNQLSQSIDDYNKNSMANLVLTLSILLMLLMIAGIVFLYVSEQNKKAYVEQKDAQKNTRAIYLLLREMIPLREGVLTSRATVSEEITGAIADSVNQTIDSLANVVKKIQSSSMTMREKTNDASNVAVEMLQLNEKQALSIAKTGEDVLKINSAISEISKRTLVTSQQANEAAKVAESGAEQVGSAISSMKSIDDNMSETTILMKKVSESSKQISEILGLLSDITEQTNILALNATIQAAKAGEAGKGFNIVAESIQGLADKASEATRKVGALIGTVQTDISSVSTSLQRTTEQVKSGVELSERAGVSMDELIMQSQTLAEIIEGVSQDTKLYSSEMEKISHNMQIVLKTSEENKASTEQTVESINEIAEISQNLGESVQQFKIE